MHTKELEVAINSAPVTISWISSDLIYLGVNPLLATLMKTNSEDIVGTKLGSYTEQTFIQEFAQELFNSPEPQLSREIYTILDEQEHWYHILGRKYDNNSKATLIGIDISKQKESQRKATLMEKLAMIGEVASNLIHEINNPLTTINLKTQKLKKLEFNDAKDLHQQVIEIADQLIDTERRVSEIIKTMKRVSHVDTTSSDTKLPCNISTLIQQALELCEAKLKSQHITITCHIEKDLELNIFETEILQLIVNLITNSTDAINNMQKKWIKIAAITSQNHCLISVCDSGNGIPKHLQKKILEPFFTTKVKGKGTGIGLGLCQKFAANHQGTFYIDNTSPNTKFVLKLPLMLPTALV